MSKKIVWGILLLVIAGGLIALAFFPEFIPFLNIPVWKWFIGFALLYIAFDRLISGRNILQHLDFIFPLALLFLVFEKEIAGWAGLPEDFVNNWLVIVIALLLTAGIHLLCSNSVKKKKKKTVHIGGSEYVKGDYSEYRKNSGSSSAKDYTSEEGNYYTNCMGEGYRSFDLSGGNRSFYVENKMGELVVSFSNADSIEGPCTVMLNINNDLGETIVHVPKEWSLENNMNKTLGNITVDFSDSDGERSNGRKLVAEGTVSLGEVRFTY